MLKQNIEINRKLIHLSSLYLVIFCYFFDKNFILIFTAVIAFISICFDLIRFKYPEKN